MSYDVLVQDAVGNSRTLRVNHCRNGEHACKRALRVAFHAYGERGWRAIRALEV